MMVSNLEIVPGRRVVKHLGLVQGVRCARNTSARTCA
jgi:hypothetical protein